MNWKAVSDFSFSFCRFAPSFCFFLFSPSFSAPEDFSRRRFLPEPVRKKANERQTKRNDGVAQDDRCGADAHAGNSPAKPLYTNRSRNSRDRFAQTCTDLRRQKRNVRDRTKKNKMFSEPTCFT